MVFAGVSQFAAAYVPSTLPTPLSNVYSLTYQVTQYFRDYNGNTATSTFFENYTLNFLDNQAINVSASISYTVYLTSCLSPNQYSWYMNYIVDAPSRLINQTIQTTLTPDNGQALNYNGTHLRLYADGSVPIGGTMQSNNFELGYIWGDQAVNDITETRQGNAYYSIGAVTYNALVFQGSQSEDSASSSSASVNATPQCA
jgi:hypothetical protein